MKYPKINSIYKREGFESKTNGKLLFGEHTEPEFANIVNWDVEEKVDGTNIRICFKKEKGLELQPSIHGKTDEAQIPAELLKHLQQIATWERFYRAFDNDLDNFEVWLFGEGYGAKIQAAGANYRPDQAFILFDVYANGWWFRREHVQGVANDLGIPKSPHLGIMKEDEIIEFVRQAPWSRCSINKQTMEGVVCRPSPQMLYRDGSPIMWKLRYSEFS